VAFGGWAIGHLFGSPRTAAFHREDTEAILHIPLSYRLVSDGMIWLHTKNGEYTVRSGYHIAQLILKQGKDLGESSKVEGGSHVWAKFWKMKVPNKIRVFAWRTCQNILPTVRIYFVGKWLWMATVNDVTRP